MPNSSNSSLLESVDNLNVRYAETLLPLTVLFGFLAFAGVLGNVVVLIVFSRSRKYNKTNFKVYVLFFGVVDLFMCMTVIPGEIFKLRSYFAFDNWAACKVICYFNLLGSSATALILTIIAVERFWRVRKPLATQISPQLAVRICLICIFVSLLLACPAAVMCGIEEGSIKNIHGGNTTVYFCLAEEKFKQSVWRNVYKLGLLFTDVLIIVTCIVMYVFILRTVCQVTRRRMGADSFRLRGMSADKHVDSKKKFIEGKNADEDIEEVLAEERPNTKESSAGSRVDNVIPREGRSSSTDSANFKTFPYKPFIWFVLTVIFIVTYIIQVSLSINPYSFILSPPKLFTLSYFFSRLYLINSVINPLVYALLDSKFRRTCRRMFRERLCFCSGFF